MGMKESGTSLARRKVAAGRANRVGVASKERGATSFYGAAAANILRQGSKSKTTRYVSSTGILGQDYTTVFLLHTYVLISLGYA